MKNTGCAGVPDGIRPQRCGTDYSREVHHRRRPISGCAGLLTRIRLFSTVVTILLLATTTQAAELPTPDLSAVEPRVRTAIETQLATATAANPSPPRPGAASAWSFTPTSSTKRLNSSTPRPPVSRPPISAGSTSERSSPTPTTRLPPLASTGRQSKIDPGYAPARVRLAASLEKVGQAGEADAH